MTWKKFVKKFPTIMWKCSKIYPLLLLLLETYQQWWLCTYLICFFQWSVWISLLFSKLFQFVDVPTEWFDRVTVRFTHLIDWIFQYWRTNHHRSHHRSSESGPYLCFNNCFVPGWHLHISDEFLLQPVDILYSLCSVWSFPFCLDSSDITPIGNNWI